jgi:hypothetical protein
MGSEKSEASEGHYFLDEGIAPAMQRHCQKNMCQCIISRNVAVFTAVHH